MDFVNKNTSQIRLDIAISKELEEISRKKARALCAAGLVRVDGSIAKPGLLLSGAERIEILEKLKKAKLRPELVGKKGGARAFIKILYEDNDIIAVSKPSGMNSLRQRAEDGITLADCIAEYFPACASVSENSLEAGLLQRLDFYTSGVILAAKNKSAHAAFRSAFREKKFLKTYLARVEGVPKEKEFEIEIPLFSLAKKMRVAKEGERGALFAKTKVNFLKELGGKQSLLRLTTTSGRRHQIRAHLALSGYPLVGDELYGARSKLGDREGFFLHAESISGENPISGKKFKIVDELEKFSF